MKIIEDSEITLEIDGRKTAFAESYFVKTVKQERSVYSIGSTGPVKTMPGKIHYEITLTRILSSLTGEADFYLDKIFDVVIIKKHEKIVFSSCRVVSISEKAAVNTTESITLVSYTRRREVL